VARLLVALERPDAGTVDFDGHRVSHLPEGRLRPLRRRFQMVFQDSTASLNPRKSVYDLLAAPLWHHRLVGRSQLSAEVDRLLDQVGLVPSMKTRYPHEFSGGQRQRLGIARALSLRPDLLVCDEPVSALDVSVQAQVLNLLRGLQRDLGLTYLFIGHGLGAVSSLSDRIAVMYLGKVVEVGPVATLFSAPRHPYTQALLDASPVPDPRRRNRDRVVLNGEVSSTSPPAGCRFHPRCALARPECRHGDKPLAPVGLDHLSACPVVNAREARP